MARDRLFDLAVARALAYAARLGPVGRAAQRDELTGRLELWYLKTRFAYRVPLDEVVEALLRFPGPGHEWRGGKEGGWVAAGRAAKDG